MFFTIEKDVLLDNLNILQKGLPLKTPMPVLTGIKLEVLEDQIILTTSNTDISIKTIIDAHIKIKETGNIVVPGKFFIEIIKKINSRYIEISLIEDTIINIVADKSEFKLRTLEYLDYPKIDFIESLAPISLDSTTLKTIIRETSYAAGINEKRPILTGVNIKCNGTEIEAIATDSYRLSQKKLTLKNSVEEFNIVLPTKALEELSKSLDIFNEDVEMFVSNNKVLFKFNNVLFQTRLLDGTYPDTSRLIPNVFPIIVKFNKEELLQAVDRVSLLSPREKETNYNIIRLAIREDQVVEITSTNYEIGDAFEEIIPTDTIVGPIIKVAFSSKYLVEALKSFSSSEVTLNFTGEIKPFVIKGDLDEGLIALILPVKVD